MVMRLNVNLADDVADALQGIADRYGCSITEAVRRAISSQHFLDGEVADGAKVLIARPGKDGDVLREVEW